jgi:hypothetical protein
LATTWRTWSAKITPRLPWSAATSTFWSSSSPKSHHFSVLPSSAKGSWPDSMFWTSALSEISVSWPRAPGAKLPVISTGRAVWPAAATSAA